MTGKGSGAAIMIMPNKPRLRHHNPTPAPSLPQGTFVWYIYAWWSWKYLCSTVPPVEPTESAAVIAAPDTGEKVQGRERMDLNLDSWLSSTLRRLVLSKGWWFSIGLDDEYKKKPSFLQSINFTYIQDLSLLLEDMIRLAHMGSICGRHCQRLFLW